MEQPGRLWCIWSVAAISLSEITSEGEVKPVRCTMSRLRHPGATMSGFFYYFSASRRRSARAAEARRLGIDYVLRTVGYILILHVFRVLVIDYSINFYCGHICFALGL